MTKKGVNKDYVRTKKGVIKDYVRTKKGVIKDYVRTNFCLNLEQWVLCL